MEAVLTASLFSFSLEDVLAPFYHLVISCLDAGPLASRQAVYVRSPGSADDWRTAGYITPGPNGALTDNAQSCTSYGLEGERKGG